jgi:four helix bundle protein
MTNVEENDEKQMTKGCQMADLPDSNEVPPHRNYDLEERSAQFGEAVVNLARTVPLNPVTEPIISQVVRSSTAIGAHYCEADDAGSKKEFRYRISLCKRESRETKHWLRMMAAAVPDRKQEIRPFWREAKELNLIFSAIYRGRQRE